MKKSIFAGKSVRTKVFTVITVLLVLIILGGNLLITYFGDLRLWQIDLTPESFYHMSDLMNKTVSDIVNAKDSDGNKRLKNPVKITFCSDPDVLEGSYALRPTYFMALELQKKYPDDFKVEAVNVEVYPSEVSMYKTTSRDEIGPADMIVSYGGKYRVIDALGYWEGEYTAYDGEYRLASAIASLTAVDLPVAYFVTGHGETVYDPQNPDSDSSKAVGELADLLYESGMQIKLLDISEVDRIPEDCSLLIINAPTSDFSVDADKLGSFSYVSDTEKLDRYLVSHSGAIIVNKGYDVELPSLESFLREWGISFGDAEVRDMTNYIITPDAEDDGKNVIAVYDPSEENIGYAYYGNYAGLSSAPAMVFPGTGYVYCSYTDGETMAEPGSLNTDRNYAAFIGTTEDAVAYDAGGSITIDKGGKTLAAFAVRTYLDETSNETSYSYIFATNSADFFSNDVLGNASYANRGVMNTVIRDISRTETYADIDLGSLSRNSANLGGKVSLSTTLTAEGEKVINPDGTNGYNNAFGTAERNWFTVLIFVAPAGLLIGAVVVFIRRKFR